MFVLETLRHNPCQASDITTSTILPMPHTRTIVWVAMTVLAASHCTSVSRSGSHAPPPEPAAVAGFFSETQAARGREMFTSMCSACHDTREFRGAEFEWDWRRQTVWDLYKTMAETMPEDAPGSLSPETYAAVIAYILSINEYPAGPIDLTPAQASMDSVPLGPNADKTGRGSSTDT